jgi:hypothetical protein
MGIASRMSKMFSKAEVDKMDTAAKKAAGSPGYDADTLAAQKEFDKEKAATASKKLTKKEEAAADKEAYASAMGKDKPAAKKGALTEKEKKDLQQSLDYKSGGYVAKKKVAMAKGGYVNCGASVPPAQKGKK